MIRFVLLLLLSGSCFGQYAEPVQSQVVDELEWQETTTNEFEYHGEGYLIDHLRNHPMLGNELERLHEWLHQKIEKLRPRNAYSFIMVEATEEQFASWPDRASIEASGWKIVRQPVRDSIRNIVAIGNQHFSHAGYLTNAALHKFVNQVQNRRVKPLKSAKARWAAKITMYTRDPCVWCDRWMATEYPKAIAAGVLVEFVTDPNGSVPRFDVCDEAGQCRRFTGFTTWNAMKGEI